MANHGRCYIDVATDEELSDMGIESWRQWDEERAKCKKDLDYHYGKLYEMYSLRGKTEKAQKCLDKIEDEEYRAYLIDPWPFWLCGGD